MENKYYIYLHYNSKSPLPFYVGMGKLKKVGFPFSRAYNVTSRNFLWKRYYKKYGLKVKILNYFSSLEDCLKEETRLITLYGLIFDSTGVLCNLIRENKEFKKFSLEPLKKHYEKIKKPTYQYSLDGKFLKKFESLTEASIVTGLKCSDIRDAILGRKHRCSNFLWSYEKLEFCKSYKELKKRSRKTNQLKSNPIYQFSTDGEFIKEWESSLLASRELKISYSGIRNCIDKANKTSGNFFWSYSKNFQPNKLSIVSVFLIEENKFERFKSYSEAEKFLNLSKNTISTLLQRKREYTYKNKYVFYRI